MGQAGDAYDIAITGYACRLPGAPSVREFRNVLEEGRCVVGEVGRDRFEPGLIWDPDRSARGKSYTLAAGQVDNIWDFDPGFFSLSPREAMQMDPQQRILLQVVWEALEHGGHRVSDLAGERTGVFVGAASSDYSNTFFMDLARIDAQFMTGNTLSIISNRVSYLLNLKGPSFTVDTACSSSFFALHHAALALMSGEIDTAIVGGVNLLVSPAPFVGFSRASMLSPTGRCRAFDAGADGYVRSEGAVAVVLRRLAAARAAGDRVRGIVMGTGVNSDGRTVGMALPSVVRQTDLLGRMRETFGVEPDRLAFVEAHGTGTPVGDPVEAQAIGTVFGRGRARPLPIGSAKTNFGHLEPAAGLVGLLKAQIALETGRLPASLHLAKPNPNIDFEGLNLAVAQEPVTFAPAGQPWIAGVNSFGFGGANAHVLLRQPTAGEAATDRPAPLASRALTISAASAEGLSRLALLWRDRVAGADEADLPALAAAAAWNREPLSHRLVARPCDKAGLVGALDAHAQGRRDPALILGRTTRTAGRTAFLFCGNGAQWAGMGRHLHATDPDFARGFDHIAGLFAALGCEDLRALLADDGLGARLSAATVAQPILFAVQMALVEALGREGLVPGAVAGHSVGEVAAACTAGIIALKDAVRLIYTRSAALETLRGSGGMAAISAAAGEVAQAIEVSGATDVVISGLNSPRSVTVSGPADQIRTLLAWLRRNRRVAGVPLEVAIPYHSPAVDPLRRRLIEDLKTLRPAEGRMPFASSTTGRLAHGLALDADYWWRNAREVVRFEEAVEALCELGCQTFVEIAPRPVLATYVRDKLKALGHAASCVRTMDQGAGAGLDAAGMVALAYAEGARIDTARVFGPRPGPGPELPSYPWNNAPYRAEATQEAANNWGSLDFHPLIGRAMLPGQSVWQGDINPRTVPWLADHMVDQAIVLPATAFAEMALAAGVRLTGHERVELSDLEIVRPLVIETSGSAEIRVSGDALTGSLRIESRPRLSGSDWALHAFGTARGLPPGPCPAIAPVEGGEVLSASDLYGRLAALGLAYGPRFRLAGEVTVRDGRASAPIASAEGPQDGRFHLNPAQFDAALHAVLAILVAGGIGSGGDNALLPVRIGRLRLFRPGADVALARIEVTARTPRGATVSVALLAADGETVALAEGLRLQKARLRGRPAHDGLAWRQRLVRLRGTDKAVSLPKGWAVPANRLTALGIVARGNPEPDAGALLLDAGYRRLAWDTMARLRAAEGQGAAAEPAPERLVAAMTGALREDGLAEASPPGTGGGGADCPYPPLADIVRSLWRSAPERAADLADLVRAETLLASLPGAALPPEGAAQAGIDLGSAARSLWEGLGRAAHDLAQSWVPGERLNVLLLGAPSPGLVARLALHPRIDRVTVTAPAERTVDLLRRTLPALPGLEIRALAEALPAHGHDVALAADVLDLLGEDDLDRLAESLALAGLLVAAEPEAGPGRMIRAALAGETAAGALRGDRTERLAAAFREVTRQPLATGIAEAAMLTARPRRQAVRAILPEVPKDAGRAALLVLSDRRPGNLNLAALVEASLSAAGITVRQCLADDAALADTACNDVVMLAHLPEPADAPLAAAERRIATLRTILAMHDRPQRVWAVTAGGRLAPVPLDGTRIPADAAFAGAIRVLVNETPSCRFHTVDFAPGTPVEDLAERLCSLIVSGTDETEIVIDGTGALAPRIEPAPLPSRDGSRGDALVLGIGRQGALETLEWQRCFRRAPAAGEVEIGVRAAGLNFRDLMWAQGLLPEEALIDGFAGPTLGMECAGVVVRAGAESGFRKGDRVAAFAPACFATHVTVAAAAVMPVPAGSSFESAASIPTVFFTAVYGLSTLANLRPGETVLIHGGAGGVGLAALQVARARGARVFATAGSPAKRRLLAHLGAEGLFDSRSLAFADEVLAATGGRGVDVVLNSLAGEAMERSLACLAPFGRFIELGKRDFFANSRLGLRPFRRNLSYFGVDADQILRARPDLARAVLGEVAAGFASGAYVAPPCQSFEAGEIVDAFRHMQHARHVGKIVVRAPEKPDARQPVPGRPVRDAWLVTGGLRGFGLATAEWLAAHGARKLWLVSRSGRPEAGDAAAIERLRAAGTVVETRSADVTREAALRGLLDEIAADEVPLRGIVHAAMVLDDGLSAGLDAERIRAVLAPKIRGGENLDRLGRDFDLDHFIFYSSVTTLFGNPGQVAYVAANAYLESLAAARAEAGLPALAIAWGPIADRGYLARDTRTRDLLGKRLGTRMLTTAEALSALGALLDGGEAGPVAVVAPMRWRALAADLTLLSTPLFSRIDFDDGGGIVGGAADLLAAIADLGDEAAAAKVAVALAAEAARILRQPVSDIDPYQPLTELGFDSLMAMDLKLATEEALGVTIPLLSIGDGMTLAQLSARVVAQVRGRGQTLTGDAEGDLVASQHLGDRPREIDDEIVRRVSEEAERIR